MRTWNDYKEHVKSVDPEIGKDMDEILNTYSDEEIENNEEILDELDRLNNLSDGLLALIVENKMDPKDVNGS